jgi:hypothetical protein
MKQRPERRRFVPGSQPLGIYFHDDDAVSLVWSHARAGEMLVVEAAHVPIEGEDDQARRDARCTSILLELLRSRKISERRCIIGIHPDNVLCEPLEIAKGFTFREMQGAAAIKAESMVRYPASERLIAVDEIPRNDRYRLLSVAKKSEVERLVRIVTDAALTPYAIDVPLAAWPRLADDADALLDLTHERAILTIFRDPHPTGLTKIFPARLQGERIAAEVKNELYAARDRGIKDVARLVVYGTDETTKTVAQRLRAADDALTILPLRVEGLDAPPWAYALALATWTCDREAA